MEQETASKRHRPLVSLLSARWPSCLHGAARAFSPALPPLLNLPPSAPSRQEPSALHPAQKGAVTCPWLCSDDHTWAPRLGPWTSHLSSESVICHLGMRGRHWGYNSSPEASIPSTTRAPSGNRGQVRSWRLEFSGSLYWEGGGACRFLLFRNICTHMHTYTCISQKHRLLKVSKAS